MGSPGIPAATESRDDPALEKTGRRAHGRDGAGLGPLFESASIGMALVGTDGRLLKINDALCEALESSREELLDLSAEDVTRIIDPSGRERTGAIAAPAGRTRPRIEEGRADAHARELEQSNRDLESFASVASHDLQEPLRRIQALGSRLAERRGEELGEEGREYLDRILDAGRWAGVLIHDLLAYSRLTAQGREFRKVDVGQVVREVVSQLKIDPENSGARLEVGPLPVVDGDPTQIRQLMQNLIGNALKFRRQGRDPTVKIGGETVRSPSGGGPVHRILVSDDGIGFDNRCRRKVFRAFQRLHGRREYEGTGMGLAICRRIVERHGGRIAARGRPGKGATFTVELPGLA